MIDILSYRASDIAYLTNGTLNGANTLINKISLNSKEKGDSWCFIAIKGKSFNGADFIDEAIKNGASLIITEENIKSIVPVVNVNSAIKALGKISSAHIKNTKIVAITGSVGKTTTKEMVLAVLKEKYKTYGTKQNENNEIGVPLTLLAGQNHDFCVVEMGMRARDEIDYLASICQPECAIITNCGTSHLETLKTKNNIFLAKTEILNYLPKYAILPNEPRFKCLKLEGTTPFYIGEKSPTVYDYKYTNDGIIFSIIDNDRIIENIKIKSFAFHNLNNALIAYTVGKIYGLSNSEIKQGIEKFKAPKMREEYLKINDITVINDCYNSSYESMESALISLTKYAEIKGKLPSLLIGDILEAGKDAHTIHKRIGKLCKKLGIKYLFAFGENAGYVIEGFEKGSLFTNKNDIAKEIINKLGGNDVLLVKASRGAHFETIIQDMKEI
ncbi:MAG: UDP-N-acetylmuramoyl-tripeptide--D-alanyl-D-alanine ligase [Clostridia bacterium]|nr:UDP-N-acetylmuramoyl-tripeptide--D-alanyl-D-alanine ligase [Clostridia bacterium]